MAFRAFTTLCLHHHHSSPRICSSSQTNSVCPLHTPHAPSSSPWAAPFSSVSLNFTHLSPPSRMFSEFICAVACIRLWFLFKAECHGLSAPPSTDICLVSALRVLRAMPTALFYLSFSLCIWGRFLGCSGHVAEGGHPAALECQVFRSSLQPGPSSKVLRLRP